MNRREKTLVILVVAALVGGIGFKMVKSMVIENLDNMETSIKAKDKALERCRIERAQEKSQKSIWEMRVAESLSLDPVDAKIKMMNELSALANQHGLGNNAVRPVSERPNKLGVTPLEFTIDGTAPLNNCVSFLYDLHNLPFRLRVETVKFAPKTGKDKGKIQLTVKGETLVLPEQKNAPTTQVAVLKPDKRKEVLRTELAKASEYRAIWDKKPFEAYVAPPPKPVDPPKVVVEPPNPPTQPVVTPPTTPVVQQPTRDPMRNSLKITGLIGTPDTQQVIVTGGDQKRRYVEVGDPFDGGKLVYVHPEGAVAMYMEKPWYYPFGRMMSDGVELSEDANPQIYAILTGQLPVATQPSGE